MAVEEAHVLAYVNEQNRPLNSQNVADALQKYNLKKAGIQKALDNLADSGRISFKEYGKQRIYLAKQDQFEIPNAEELEQMKKLNDALQEELASEKKAVTELEAEIRSVESNMTGEQIAEKVSKLTEKIARMEKKLAKLREGPPAMTSEDRQKIQEAYESKMAQWRKRKRMFKDLWDMITETMPRNHAEFKEELGIETDEDAGVSLQDFCNISKKQKR